MRHLAVCLLLLALVPTAVRAADAPEKLLPAGTQLYLRWDGVAAHRAAYEKTALGRMLKGDTGTFVQKGFGQIRDALTALLTVAPLLQGAPPGELLKLQADAAQVGRLPSVLADHGFILAVEVRSLEPPQGQATLILPDVGKPDPLFGALHLTTTLAKIPVQKKKIEGRSVSFLPLPVTLAWWLEGKHAVLTLGTDPVEKLVTAMVKPGGKRLTSNPLFQRVSGFKGFETAARAYLDGASLIRMGGARSKELKQLLADLGLADLRSLVFYHGFDGSAERGLSEVELPAGNKGLQKLLAGKPFRLGDVPPLPPDVISWSMTNFDLAALYDAAITTATGITRMVAPKEVGQVKEVVKQINAALGIDLRNDLLVPLGDRFVEYNTPSEGPFTLGETLLFKVRDGAKVQESLEQLARSLATLAGKEARIKKQTYRGVTLRTVHVKEQGFFIAPTFAVCDGWLAVGFYPQNIHSFIRRSQGDLKAWKPSLRVQQLLGKLPQEYMSISYADPRPSVKQLLSIAPLIGALVNSLNASSILDVSSLPSAQEATRYLFPNIAVTTYDGKTLRQESRSSLPLPFNITGVDSYFFVFLGFARVAF